MENGIRRIEPSEPLFERGLSLVICGTMRSGAPEQRRIEALYEIAERQNLELGPLVGAIAHRRLDTAALAIQAPGRTAMVYTPPVQLRGSHQGRLSEALDLLTSECGQLGISLLQTLIAPHETLRPHLFKDVGYRYLAELIYMRRPAGLSLPAEAGIEGGRLIEGPQADDAQFLAALEASYVDSLDCPGLNGIRETGDVLAGHRATGSYERDGWFLLQQGDKPAGVLLTARMPVQSALEVVYMGASPDFRGKGVGNLLLRQAVLTARRKACADVTLAVDGSNAPARRLYRRWEFGETSRRRAWIICPHWRTAPAAEA